MTREPTTNQGTTMTFQDLMTLMAEHFPLGEVGEDEEGQLVIYTGLKEQTSGEVVAF